MNPIIEIERYASPAPFPQSLAWDGSSLWMGSLQTNHIYKLDTENFLTQETHEAPGSPWGMTWAGEELWLICGETESDDRYLRRYNPSSGFNAAYRTPCPNNTGSQLSYDGKTIRLSQWYNQVFLSIDDRGAILKAIGAPRGICGQVAVGEFIYCITTADEETNDYFLSRISIGGERPVTTDIAHVPFPARALAFDGQRFWTNHRAKHEIVCFEKPD